MADALKFHTPQSISLMLANERPRTLNRKTSKAGG